MGRTGPNTIKQIEPDSERQIRVPLLVGPRFDIAPCVYDMEVETEQGTDARQREKRRERGGIKGI